MPCLQRGCDQRERLGELLLGGLAPPFDPAAGIVGYTPRGIDVDSNGVVWTALASSGHLASFDRRKCKGPLQGPAATSGQHCREGWTLHPVPGPRFRGVRGDVAVDFQYYNFVDRFNTFGLGNNVPFANGTNSDSLLALQPDGTWLVLRVPYPLGFFSRGMDGRIDDPNAGWKGRAIYADYGPNAVWHMEGGLGTRSAVVLPISQYEKLAPQNLRYDRAEKAYRRADTFAPIGPCVALGLDPSNLKVEGLVNGAVRQSSSTRELIHPVPKLVEFVSRAAKIQRVEKPQEAHEEIADRLPAILKLIRRQTGHDFSSYKTSTVIRRIARRMAVSGLEEVGVYLRLLQEHPEEVRSLFKDLLISVTNFFRDPEAFAALRKDVVAPLIEGIEPGQPVKVWVAGCATGEEAYSVAILFREEMLARKRNDLKVQIFATDLDEAAIETARLGRFPANIAADVSPAQLEQYFRRVGDIYQVSNPIREMVVFSVHGTGDEEAIRLLKDRLNVAPLPTMDDACKAAVGAAR